ncbi:GNAT family N-acetyltransferase [Roseicitreum antarcticum]|uniref:L-ornithine N(alpha)-acyltransferase n=1 Tax=Roseicitreum antarcticum TaxID=564137 RepID=A0A1H3D952_9RHOB|nr:GNAT family N-acyltransferase [Roseicitreum antarcticum]SDX63052.1 ornithine-acyl[acyl carrier protein] N-acyltransferase [Roseicitreum antarcticum]
MGNLDTRFQSQGAAIPGPGLPGMATGRFGVERAVSVRDIEAAFDLRARVFRGGQRDDRDRFDDACEHYVIRGQNSGAVVGCFRVLHCADGRAVRHSYSAQSYDLRAFYPLEQPLLELGRFCVDPAHADADVMRLAWAEVTRLVDDSGAAFLFGCTSFRGNDPSAFADSFALLHARHRAPAAWRIGHGEAEVLAFDTLPPMQDGARAMRGLPSLLRSYLALGGWVSDHAVIDRDLGTMHVFTGLEIAAIPPARQRLLRAVAAKV